MAVGWASEESHQHEQDAVINSALASIRRSYNNTCPCGKKTDRVVLCESCLSKRRKK